MLDLASQIFQIMFPIIAIVLIGVLTGRRQHIDFESANQVNLSIFIPALVFASLSQESFDFYSHSLLALLGLLLVGLTAIVAIPTARASRIDYKSIAPPLMFHNAGNVGLPLFALALGPEGLAAGLVLFLVGNIAHFGLGSYMLDQKAHWLRSVAQPAILAAALAFLIRYSPWTPPDFVMLPIEMLGNIAVPLMLFSLGLRLAQSSFDDWQSGLLVGILTPIIGVSLAALLLYWFHLPPYQAAALLLFGALPPAVMNFLFAERYQQEPQRVSAMVLFGNVCGVVSLPIALSYVLPRLPY